MRFFLRLLARSEPFPGLFSYAVDREAEGRQQVVYKQPRPVQKRHKNQRTSICMKGGNRGGFITQVDQLTAVRHRAENRWRRAPPQPFPGQAREKSLRASSQVFCESCPSNRRAGLVLSADQTPDHASRISAMEGRQRRKPPRRNSRTECDSPVATT